MATKAKKSPSPKHQQILDMLSDCYAAAVEAEHAFCRLNELRRVDEFPGLPEAWNKALEAVDATLLAASDWCIAHGLRPRIVVCREAV